MMKHFEFFFDLLYPLPLVERSMFGVKAYYLEDKIIVAYNVNDKWKEDIGIWVSAPVEYQDQLVKTIKEYRYLKRIPTKKWILLPADSDTFEEDAINIATLITQRSEWIGTVPKTKTKSKRT